MRSIAQKRFTAVGRVRASVSQMISNCASSSVGIGVQNAERHSHRGGHPDRRSARG